MAILKALAQVQAGHPFRGGVRPVANGNAHALQMRDLSPTGRVGWETLVRTRIEGRRSASWLQSGDVIFVARGARNYAVCLREVPRPTVCSPHFFRLRVRSHALLPEFLAWQINRAPAQRYLASNAEGSDQLSIRRSVLENLPLAVPPLQRQALIVALAEAALQEEHRLRALLHNRQQQQDGLALALLASETAAETDSP